MKKSERVRRGQVVYWWVSSSDIAEVKFVRWTRTRMSTGRADTNWIGVGAIVSSKWRFSIVVSPHIDRQCRRGQALVRPYMPLYFSRSDAELHRNEIQKPRLIDIR